jgi:hypothetical protein
MSRRRPRVYAAHPIATYGTARERDCLAALAVLLPGAELYDPSGRYRTNLAWRRAWPRVLGTLSGLVVFGNREGVVGIGCLLEVADARGRGLPVAVLDHRCRLRALGGFGPTRRSPTARRTAVLLSGSPVDPAGFPGGAR